MGLFFNYASNTLMYSQTLNANFKSGQKAHDKILGMDLSFGTGITDRWDVGINMPVILKQNVENDYYVSSYDETGVTEVKVNTKYRFLGDEKGGVAGILSINKNLIENNPFAGRDPGLTFNYELAADTTFASKWAAALNVGYRDRNPGKKIDNVAFVPMQDQWIYSVATSYLIASLDTKFIAEVYGSRNVKNVDQDTDRSLNSLEGLLGVKYDATTSMAVHAGGATQLDSSMGGPDWRVYAGLNWAVDLGCDDKKPVVVASSSPTEPQLEVYNLEVDLNFSTNSDQISAPRYKELEQFFKETFSKPYVKLEVAGHTDSVGPDEYNKDLSERRAKAVREYFINTYNLKPDSITAVGYGSTQPIGDNGNYQGRRKNRRVELRIHRYKN